MRDQTWFNLVAATVAISVILAGFVAIAFSNATASAPNSAATAAPSAGVDRMYLTIAFNPATGIDEYFPANFSLPAHTLVEFSITSYDNGTNVVAATANTVMGTVGNVAVEAPAPGAAPVEYTHLPLTGIAHTFTIEQSAAMAGTAMGSGPYALNVPIPSATSLSQPSTVTFSAYFNATGAMTWVCLAPCDPMAMMVPGFMSGTITVV
jgi:hypothetical protein